MTPSAPPNEIQQAAYRDFARTCFDRRKEAQVLLRSIASSPLDAALATETLLRSFHDLIGEAKFIGMDALSEAGAEFLEVLRSARESLGSDSVRAQMTDWIDRLSTIAVHYAEALAIEADTGQSRWRAQLQTLRLEFQHARQADGAHKRRTTGINIEVAPSGDAPVGEAFSQALPAAGRRIVLLDDSPVIRKVLKAHLVSKGHDVRATANVAEFETQLREFQPQLVILDIHMPRMTGDQVCRRLREGVGTEMLPVVFLSSLSDAELSQLAEEAGANGFLSKQHGIENLMTFLDDVLGQIVF